MEISVIDVFKIKGGWSVSIRGSGDNYDFPDIQQAEMFAREYATVMSIERIHIRENSTSSRLILSKPESAPNETP